MAHIFKFDPVLENVNVQPLDRAVGGKPYNSCSALRIKNKSSFNMVSASKSTAKKNIVNKKKPVVKSKVSSMLSGSYEGAYNGRFREDMEVRELSNSDKDRVDDYLRTVYKNCKMLPAKGWENFLENQRIMDKAFVAFGRDGDANEDHLWRAKHWRLIQYHIFDYIRGRHKNLMSLWGRQVKSKSAAKTVSA